MDPSMEELIWTLLVSISGGLMYEETPHSNEECHTERHLFAQHLMEVASGMYSAGRCTIHVKSVVI